MITIQINPIHADAADAIAYTGFIIKKEIGCINIIANPNFGFFKIESFRVKEKYRKTGIGRQLLDAMVHEISKVGGGNLMVYPNSEPYEGDSYINHPNLYQIYEHLGFVLEDPSSDKSRPNHKMILEIPSSTNEKIK